MKTIIKVYKKDCEPCKELSKVLAEVQEDTPFELEEYDITASGFTERRTGKGFLMKYAATIPFLLFKDKDLIYAAHYNESGVATTELIKEKLQ